jgi:bifunctional ADP-heptose synthase (sugar kinase/adenylyltransferase)
VKQNLQKYKINFNILVNKSKQTVLKERFWCNNYKLIQVDYVDNSIIDKSNQHKISNLIKKTKSDSVVFSDFRHGMFNREIINSYSNLIPSGAIKVADSQVSSRWGNILDFKDFDILFPNETEARFALADQDSGIRNIGAQIIEKSNCKNLVLKIGDKGSMIFRNKGFYPKDFFPLDSFVSNKIDTIGAGDAYLAATTVFYTYTKNIVISSIIGNFAAAIACQQEGNIPISRDKIISFINSLNLR